MVENARRKAVAGRRCAGAGARDVALGVDTDVVLDGRALGKAANEDEARERLEALSGRTHEVLSAWSRRWRPRVRGAKLAIRRRERRWSPSRRSTRPTLERYLASGEWRDRAGAYAIQGLGSILIERLEGDFSNVVGLPLQLLLDLAPELSRPISSESAE